MTFEKLSDSNIGSENGRKCIIVYNFNGKELKSVNNYAAMMGMRDQIIIYSKNADTKINELLDNKIDASCENGRKEKAIIFNNIPSAKINVFIDNLKKVRINNVLKAVVTETSINWSVNDLVSNLAAERIALSKGNFADIHNK